MTPIGIWTPRRMIGRWSHTQLRRRAGPWI